MSTSFHHVVGIKRALPKEGVAAPTLSMTEGDPLLIFEHWHLVNRKSAPQLIFLPIKDEIIMMVFWVVGTCTSRFKLLSSLPTLLGRNLSFDLQNNTQIIKDIQKPTKGG